MENKNEKVAFATEEKSKVSPTSMVDSRIVGKTTLDTATNQSKSECVTPASKIELTNISPAKVPEVSQKLEFEEDKNIASTKQNNTKSKEYNSLTLENFPALMRNCVHIRNRKRVEVLINEIVAGGPNKLQVISDFDQTITKQHVNGQRCLSSFGVFGHCPHLPQNYREQSQALFNQYRPIEIDPEMTVEEKIPHMVEWYEKAQDLLTGFALPQSYLDQVLDEVSLELRTGTDTMLTRLDKSGVPVLVFSAGLGDMVAAILRHHSSLLPNVHIISNFLQYDGDMLRGFQGQIIHTFNKNEHAIENSDYFSLLSGRSNVILLGDSEGDAFMAEGVKDSNAVLKIGFLYERVEESLNIYQDIYDIVLVDDQTMDVPNQLLNAVL